MIKKFLGENNIDKDHAFEDDEDVNEIVGFVQANYPELTDIFKNIGGKSFEKRLLGYTLLAQVLLGVIY
jgi:hypothetical protein